MQDNFSRGNPRELTPLLTRTWPVDRRLRRQISLMRSQPMRADQDVLDCGKYRREQQID
jgi:hypothetical protein